MVSDLSGRRQSVIIEGCTSHVSLVQFGVPQGSILGPLLFIIIMDHLTMSTGAKLILYLLLQNSQF